MCGLVGCVGNLTSFDRKAFKQLLIIDTLRGDDGTGIGFVTKEKMIPGVVKAAGSPYYLFGRETARPFISGHNFEIDTPCRVLIGHNRAATVGSLTDDNSHPFVHGDIIGAHNGTLKAGYLWKLDDYKNFEVDSEAVIYNISKHGPDAIKNVAGAYALTWWNNEEKNMYFIRNSERPLFYTMAKDGSTFWWASEAWMLEVVLKRNHVEMEKIESFKVDTLYKIYVGHEKIETQFKGTKLEEVGILKGFQTPIVMGNFGGHYGGGYGDFYGNYEGYSQAYKTTKPTTVITFPKSNQQKAKQLNKQLHNTIISFYVDSKKTGDNKIDYLSCSPSNPHDDFQIRVYDNKSPLFDELVKSCATNDIYKARVRKVVSYANEEPYVLLDYRTIETVTTQVSKDGKIEIRGHDGRYLTPEEFITNTNKGCAWCASSVDIEHHNTITWLDKDEFLCEDCKKSDEVQQYIPNMLFH